jgi:putative ABC transport system permease protein
LSYTVSLRTHEMGVRLALGARQGDILRMILGKGLALIVVGVALGLLGSLVLTRHLAHQVWGVSLTDSWTYGSVAICIVAVGLASWFSPARRVARVDPTVTLRYD